MHFRTQHSFSMNKSLITRCQLNIYILLIITSVPYYPRLWNSNHFVMFYTPYYSTYETIILLCFAHCITPHVKIFILLCFTDRFTPHVNFFQLCFAHRITPHMKIHFYSYCLHTVLPHIWNFIILLCFAHHIIPHFDTKWAYEQIIKDELIIVLFLFFFSSIIVKYTPFLRGGPSDF